MKDSGTRFPSVNTNFPKVSIVVPVYNGGRATRKAVRSIQKQNLEEIEIILVDDCSTDYTLSVMKELKKEDKRIRIVKNKKNRGVLFSRMNGALKSKGEYVAFLDADDAFCNGGIIKDLYEEAVKEKLDLVQCDYFVGLFDGEEDMQTKMLATGANSKAYGKVLKQPEITKKFYKVLQEKKDSILPVAFGKLYSRELIEKMAKLLSSDFYKENIIYNDDFIMVLAAAKEAKSAKLLKLGGNWHWYDNPNGRSYKTFDMTPDSKYVRPEISNKRIGDYLMTIEKAFEITENDPTSEKFRMSLFESFTKPEDHRIAIAHCDKFEIVLKLCKEFQHWEYASKENKKKARELGADMMGYVMDIETYKRFKYQYYMLFENKGDL